MKLLVSLVVYKQSWSLIENVIDSLIRAVNETKILFASIVVVDNFGDSALSKKLSHRYSNINEMFDLRLIQGQGNLGYGLGNNLATNVLGYDYVLVLNPDVIIHQGVFEIALDYLSNNNDVVLVSPKILNEKGTLESGVKSYPSVFVLLLRFLNNKKLNRLFQKKLADYENHQVVNSNSITDVNIVSGCFMLFRSSILKQLGGFDSRYFMYFEDFDLSFRARKLGRVVYHPDVVVTHYGGGAGRKGLKHIKYFSSSMVKFFNRYGWKLV
ncbi:glycosyltransferase family 2 protein [Endozoicomonas sp. SM1973]|uniref:Glycosyltransferase family 2 protein n=1 Tax=Spartinivicinus marinus TaxID=2994442 RepID=A0A853I8J0_9GAMM|nr:glycosyltransferase family 2 protein [Spartinivicinus marinus]MCX4028852.1 glycosyltransferase family 2 protein [Spartinivicinus marinus]NYZ65565.1 glycosyltransferase family 2 protein [Spartinivicinus marinus]